MSRKAGNSSRQARSAPEVGMGAEDRLGMIRLGENPALGVDDPRGSAVLVMGIVSDAVDARHV